MPVRLRTSETVQEEYTTNVNIVTIMMARRWFITHSMAAGIIKTQAVYSFREQ